MNYRKEVIEFIAPGYPEFRTGAILFAKYMVKIALEKEKEKFKRRQQKIINKEYKK